MVATVDFNCVMEKLMRYTKNITETNVYEEKGKVRATINQVSAAKIVWKTSVAEFHWPEFHSLLSDNWISDPKTFTKIVINNPRLLDWLFYGKSGKVCKALVLWANRSWMALALDLNLDLWKDLYILVD